MLNICRGVLRIYNFNECNCCVCFDGVEGLCNSRLYECHSTGVRYCLPVDLWTVAVHIISRNNYIINSCKLFLLYFLNEKSLSQLLLIFDIYLFLYGCETLSFAMREKYRFMMFKNRGLIALFWSKVQKVIGESSYK